MKEKNSTLICSKQMNSLSVWLALLSHSPDLKTFNSLSRVCKLSAIAARQVASIVASRFTKCYIGSWGWEHALVTGKQCLHGTRGVIVNNKYLTPDIYFNVNVYRLGCLNRSIPCFKIDRNCQLVSSSSSTLISQSQVDELFASAELRNFVAKLATEEFLSRQRQLNAQK